MGSIWLPELPNWLDAAGLDYRLWPGWEDRARSSGGYDQLWAVVAHHTASNTPPDNDCAWMWDNSDDRPIGAVLLDRTGRITVGAAGATNCAGKGGPYDTTHGTIPLDKGNTHTFSIEAANAGTGEPWPTVQQDAYTLLVATLCDRLDLDPGVDVIAHFEWTDRKIDPAGASRYATGSNRWDMDAFRGDVAARNNGNEDDVTDDDIERIAQAVWRIQINTAKGPANTASVLGWTYAAVADDPKVMAAPDALAEP